MGDASSRNLSEMKAYTKVEVQADMIEIYREAHKKTSKVIDDNIDAGYKIKFVDVDEPDPVEGTFHKARKNDLIADSKDGYIIFDENTFEQLDSFIATLEETINEEARQRKSTQGLADPLPEFMEDLMVKVKQNIKIKKIPTTVG